MLIVLFLLGCTSDPSTTTETDPPDDETEETEDVDTSGEPDDTGEPMCTTRIYSGGPYALTIADENGTPLAELSSTAGMTASEAAEREAQDLLGPLYQEGFAYDTEDLSGETQGALLSFGLGDASRCFAPISTKPPSALFVLVQDMDMDQLLTQLDANTTAKVSGPYLHMVEITGNHQAGGLVSSPLGRSDIDGFDWEACPANTITLRLSWDFGSTPIHEITRACEGS